MNTYQDVQSDLARRGYYKGKIDGNFGPQSQSAMMAYLESGPDTPLSAQGIAMAAKELGCDEAAIKAVWTVEAAGAGFSQGLPKILFEGHIFSKLTGHRYDATHPGISYPRWDKTKYPKTQEGRYRQLMVAVSLDLDKGFASASYGAFQILGQNYDACGYRSPYEFVRAMCQTEDEQLMAFIRFVKAKRLDDALRRLDWATFAKGYNGSAYRQNQYDAKLAAAYSHAKQ